MRTLEIKEEEALSALLSLQVPIAGAVASQNDKNPVQTHGNAAIQGTEPVTAPVQAVKWDKVSDDTTSAELLCRTQELPSWEETAHAFEECGSEDSATSDPSETVERRYSELDKPSKRARVADDAEASAPAGTKLKYSHKPARELMSCDLREYFKLPLHVAAQRLRVGTSALKRACRRLGIKSWPYRKLRNINKTIESLQSAQKSTPDHAHGPLKRRIQQLRERYVAIAANGIDASESDDLLNTIDITRPITSEMRPSSSPHIPILTMAHLAPHSTSRPMTGTTSPRMLSPSMFPMDQMMLNPFRYTNGSHSLPQAGAVQPQPLYVRQVSFPR